jgi:Rieske Fe-S protein
MYDECPCRARNREDTSGETAFSSLANDDLTMTRRRVLAAGAGTLALLLFERVPGARASTALGPTLSKKFRPPSGSHKVANLRQLSAGSALSLTDPKTGQPALVIRLSSAKKVHAYSAVCTHAGCTVAYDPGQKLMVCPCHGSAFDPAQGAAVVSGPAPSPLSTFKTAVDPKGNIWLV